VSLILFNFTHLFQFCISNLCLPAGFRIRIHLILIRIQHFRQNTDPDPRVLMIKNLKKITAEKKFNFFYYQKLQFNYT
jgi:hypothetical protein